MAISLMQSRFKDSEYSQKKYFVHAPVSDEVTDMIKAQYWANVARYLRPMDMIAIVRDDNKFYAEFLVLDAATNWAKVALLREEPLVVYDEQTMVGNVADYYVNWGGNFHKFQVRRRVDEQLMQSGFINEDEAKEWIKQHRKAISETPNVSIPLQV